MYRVLWFHFTILIKAPPCVNIVMKKGLCKNVHAGDYRSETVLNMPQISREELLGLRERSLYTSGFPRVNGQRLRNAKVTARKQKPCIKNCPVNTQRNIYRPGSVESKSQALSYVTRLEND